MNGKTKDEYAGIHAPMTYHCPTHGSISIPAPAGGWPIHETITLACSRCIAAMNAHQAEAERWIGKTKDEYAEANIPPHVKAIDARRAGHIAQDIYDEDRARADEWKARKARNDVG